MIGEGKNKAQKKYAYRGKGGLFYDVYESHHPESFHVCKVCEHYSIHNLLNVDLKNKVKSNLHNLRCLGWELL